MAMKKIVALTLAAGTLFLAGCCTTHKTARWEYRTQTLYLRAGLDQKDLNAAGKDGWEFVSATPIPNDQNLGAVAVFKRRIQ
jgi:PBP1b-binding outer membrane lipoprotein LpoB